MQVEDEELKNATWDKFEQISEGYSTQIQEAAKTIGLLNINLHLAAPIIVLPFSHNSDPQTECWVLNLGDLAFRSSPEMLRSDLKPEDNL